MTCLSKEIILERLERTRPNFGMDGSKERYRYMQWMSDTNAIKELFEEQAKHKGTPLKEGHWIGIDEEPHEVWECNHCGFVIDGSGCIDPYDYRDTYKFCPNCGARMKGDSE